MSNAQKYMSMAMQWMIQILLWSIPVCAVVVMVQYAVAYPQHFSVAELPWVVVSLALLYVFFKKVPLLRLGHRGVIVLSYAVMNIAMAVSLLHFPTEVCSDYSTIYSIALRMADGSFHASQLQHHEYAYIFNYQTGIALFESWVIRAFGPSLWPLKIINLLIVNLTACLTYIVARHLTDRSGALYALFVFATYYPVLITVNQFTNQHIATLFILAVLLLLCRRSAWAWLAAGVLIAVMNVLRPMGVILALTAAVWGWYNICAAFSEAPQPLAQRLRRVSPAIISLVLLSAAYGATIAAADTFFMRMDYTDAPMSRKKLPYFKFDKGLTGYNEPEILRYGDGDPEKFNQWEKEKLLHIASHEPMRIVRYVITKMVRYMGEFDWKYENTYDHDSSITTTYPVKLFVMWGWAQYILLGTFAAIGYRRWRRTHCIEPFQIFWLGITAVYFFIEAFSSYRYESYPVLFSFAAAYLSAVGGSGLKKNQHDEKFTNLHNQ